MLRTAWDGLTLDATALRGAAGLAGENLPLHERSLPDEVRLDNGEVAGKFNIVSTCHIEDTCGDLR